MEAQLPPYNYGHCFWLRRFAADNRTSKKAAPKQEASAWCKAAEDNGQEILRVILGGAQRGLSAGPAGQKIAETEMLSRCFILTFGRFISGVTFTRSDLIENGHMP